MTAAFCGTAFLTLNGCGFVRIPLVVPPQRILFVGDGFTSAQSSQVQQFNSGGTQNASTGSSLVVDENYGQTGARAEVPSGPWGGVPGIFAGLAAEAGLNYDVHIEAIASSTLAANYAAAHSVVNQSKWDSVVLQENYANLIPAQPFLPTYAGSPGSFCDSVQTIEQGVHAAAPKASVYLFEPWPSLATALSVSGPPDSTASANTLTATLGNIGVQYHDVYYRAAELDGNITAVAPVGEAWVRAVAASTGMATQLWSGPQPLETPDNNAQDYVYASTLGAYLSGLVLFQQITAVDVTTFGGTEVVAQQLGISSANAILLQELAQTAIKGASSTQIANPYLPNDPCSYR
ncbi:hypothetical protein D1Y84_03270 [Acidipila sp. EB88]|nr:hypothetical protein D1Y84_03270 [Acidipila sp. EB88]